MNNAEPYKEYLDRRRWLQLSGMAVAAAYIPSFVFGENNKEQSYHYFPADIKVIPFELPKNKTIPFDWLVAALPAEGQPVSITWRKPIKALNKNIRFRLTSATDVRELCTLEISLPNSKEKIGELDIRFAHYMQPFELIIPATFHSKILLQGISIKMIKGTNPFWFFIKSENNHTIPDAYLPHLLISGTGTDNGAWRKRLISFASVSTFGWMEGCVLDGMIMLAEKDRKAKKMLLQHFDKYFANDTLVYETYSNERKKGKINTVESVLPFAMLAMSDAHHPMLETAIQFCKEFSDAAGVVADEKGSNRRLKTEECYTISYPLAVLAKKLNRSDLQAMAIANLQARVKLLGTPQFIYQNGKELERPEFANWARGVAWYLLGLTKTLAILPDDETTTLLRSALQNAAELVISHQQPNGLWYCFLHEPETGFETSGSAGIAAAMAYGHSQNLLPAYCKAAAQKCRHGLQPYFTPDGFLTGTTQVNKGGAALQRNGFRVLSPYTLGFIAILETSIGS